MSLFGSTGSGRQVARNSYKVLMANKQLLLFPLLSIVGLCLVTIPFLSEFTNEFKDTSLDVFSEQRSNWASFGLLFLLYFLCYFVVLFFNVALMHCSRQYAEGQKATLAAGIQFSISRVPRLLSWTFFATAVGSLLRIGRGRATDGGFNIAVAILGVAWNVGTFFIVPVIAYEKLGPIAALKRSASIVREKLGDSIAVGLRYGIVLVLAFMVTTVVAYGISYKINDAVGIAMFVLGFGIMAAIYSALNSIAIGVLYSAVQGDSAADAKLPLN